MDMARMALRAAAANRPRTPSTARRPAAQVPGSAANIAARWNRNAATALKPAPRATAAVAVPARATVTQAPGSTSVVATRQHIDGANVLDNVRKVWRRYAWFDSDSKYTAVTLWTVATHFRDASGALVFPEFAHLGFFSPEPGCGKTRCLQILQMLCANAPNIPIEPSEAAVALMLGREHRVLLLDEGDVLFGSGKRKSAIRAILNSSYKKGGTWPRVRNGNLDDVPVDGGGCAGGFLDVVEKGTGNTLEALMQRFIKIRMAKPPAGTAIHKPREVVGEFDGRKLTGEDVAARLNQLAGAWAAQEMPNVASMTPEMPEGVELRQEELWTALLAVAQAAGGQWPQLATEAATDLSLYGGTPDVVAESMGMLADVTAGWE